MPATWLIRGNAERGGETRTEKDDAEETERGGVKGREKATDPLNERNKHKQDTKHLGHVTALASTTLENDLSTTAESHQGQTLVV